MRDADTRSRLRGSARMALVLLLAASVMGCAANRHARAVNAVGEPPSTAQSETGAETSAQIAAAAAPASTRAPAPDLPPDLPPDHIPAIRTVAAVSRDGAPRMGCQGGLSGRTLSVSSLDYFSYGVINQHPPLPLRRGEVILTFDDGPFPGRTSRILDTLDRYCAPATFFAVGQFASAYPALLRDIVERGHTLGNHSHTHPIFTQVSVNHADAQITQAALALRRPLGADPRLEAAVLPIFRFPGLGENRRLRSMAARRGLVTLSADVDSGDYRPISPAEVAARTLTRVRRRGGGIILLHDIQARTVAALPMILDGLAESGFTVVALRP